MMTDRRRTSKQIKKDQDSPAEVRNEILEEIRSNGVKPIVRNPNRDEARGDRDRTGIHQDEGKSRSEE
jgi:hypothetical protein